MTIRVLINELLDVLERNGDLEVFYTYLQLGEYAERINEVLVEVIEDEEDGYDDTGQRKIVCLDVEKKPDTYKLV